MPPFSRMCYSPFVENAAKLAEAVRARIEGVRLVYLFGSHARGDETAESDVDIAVLGSAPIDMMKRLELAGELSTLTKREVDIVDLFVASDVLKVQVLKDGILLYAENEHTCGEFEMYALSDYARLNEERALLLEDFYGTKVV